MSGFCSFDEWPFNEDGGVAVMVKWPGPNKCRLEISLTTNGKSFVHERPNIYHFSTKTVDAE